MQKMIAIKFLVKFILTYRKLLIIFACHNLLVAKLFVHGLSVSAFKMIQDYLLTQKQRTKIGSSYSTWENIISGVLQGSIVGPLFFNIFFVTYFWNMKIVVSLNTHIKSLRRLFQIT